MWCLRLTEVSIILCYISKTRESSQAKQLLKTTFKNNFQLFSFSMSHAQAAHLTNRTVHCVTPITCAGRTEHPALHSARSAGRAGGQPEGLLVCAVILSRPSCAKPPAPGPQRLRALRAEALHAAGMPLRATLKSEHEQTCRDCGLFAGLRM